MSLALSWAGLWSQEFFTTDRHGCTRRFRYLHYYAQKFSQAPEIFRSALFLPLPATEEWGEDRGEGHRQSLNPTACSSGCWSESMGKRNPPGALAKFRIRYHWWSR